MLAFHYHLQIDNQAKPTTCLGEDKKILRCPYLPTVRKDLPDIKLTVSYSPKNTEKQGLIAVTLQHILLPV